MREESREERGAERAEKGRERRGGERRGGEEREVLLHIVPLCKTHRSAIPQDLERSKEEHSIF